MNPYLRLFFMLLMTCWLEQLKAQAILITYMNPEGADVLEVCDSSLFEVTLTNTSMDPVNGITVTVELPTGAQYNPGTLANATEFNLSDLSAPVFSIPELTSAEVHTFFFYISAGCELVDAINNGQLFSNTITVDYDGGSNTVTTDPYDIETALLVITGITNQVINGSKDEQYTRTITIRNTRLGALSSFTFRDIHSEGVEITSPNGTDISTVPFTLELLLTGNDFMQIGDNDGLFELNETIIITEQILITDCGVDIDFANSMISADWGCDNEICQQTTPFTAIVNIQQSDLAPVLEFVPTAGLPSCFCANEAVPQSLMITNIGNEPAANIVLVIESKAAGAALKPTSFAVDSSGFITSWSPLFNGAIDLSSCDPTVDQGYETAIVTYPALGVGESITLMWDVLYCNKSCGRLPRSEWEYDYGFYKSCPPDPFIHVEDVLVENWDSSFVTGLVNIGPGVLTNNAVATLEYGINTDFLNSQEGSVQLEIIFDCAFEWMDNNLTLGGQSPSIDIVDADTATIVTATYELPFSGNDLTMEFDLLFLCNEDCQESLCIDSLLTSCTETCLPTPSPVVRIGVNTYLSTSDNCSAACGFSNCRELSIAYDCENIEYCIDTIPGYLRFDFEMFRTNFGTADIDDDRFPDPGNAIDTSMIRTDRAIAGDTVRTVLSGVVIEDFSTNGFAKAFIELNFYGANLIPDINGTLLTADGFSPIYSRLKIYDSSSGNYYECDSGIEIDTSEYPQAFYFRYNLNPESLADCGFPPAFRYEQGDSIILISDYRIHYNILKQYPQEPFTSIITFGGNPSAVLYNEGDNIQDYFSCGCNSALMEISGYRYDFFTGIYALPPCASSTYSGSSFFRIELGEGNFFPFEHRNLALLPEWVIKPPAFIQPVETKLTKMELQEQVILYSQELIDPVFSNGDWSYDLLPFQDPLPDEGFSFLFQYQFESSCNISGAYPLELKPPLIFNPSLPEPENPLDSTITAFTALRALIPNLNLQADIYNATSFDDKARFDFQISNFPTTVASSMSEAADFCWVQPVSATGDVFNFKLFNTETGDEYFSINGVFQIGTISAQDTMYYRLIGTNHSCESETVNIRYGWSCDPYENPIAVPCYQKNRDFTVISPPAELEMQVESPEGIFPLCDSVDYHTIEIFNAQLGAAYDLILKANLPQGLEVISGSCQLAYPSGTSFMMIGDPVDLGGGVVQWDLSALNDSIAANGLAGNGNMPNHSLTLRFKSFASCDFIAESYIIFTTVANQNCDEPTNTLSEAGERIHISGVASPYETSIALNPSPEVSCENETELNISISADALTALGDSVFVTLPLGISYVAGSYSPGSNATSDVPVTFNNNGQQVLKWPLLPGIPSGAGIGFSLTLAGFENLDCGAQLLLIQTVAPASAFCIQSGFGCNLLVETGSAFFSINIERPAFELSNFELSLYPFPGSMNMAYDLKITNNGSTATPPVIVDFYIDNDGNGILSPGDTWLFDHVVNNTLGSGSTITISGSKPVNDEFCKLIAVIDPEKHCACQTDQIGISTAIENNIQQSFTACASDSILLGIPMEAGHFYQWIPSTGVACSSCPMTMIGVENTTANIQTLNYTLVEETAEGCLINNRFMIDVYPQPQITNQSDEICAGESIELTASDGMTFQWTGPGILNPNLQTQIVSPSISSTYAVTITDAIGCEGIDSILVEVFPLPSVNAGIDTTFCEGLAGQLQANLYPGYSYQWAPPTQLSNPTVYNPFILVETPTNYSLTITDENGCQNTDEVFIDFAETPLLIVSEDTTICDGQTINLFASGADNYDWSPADFLNCTNCASVEANPFEMITYTVIGTNDSGCNSTENITITVIDGVITFDSLSTCEGLPLDIFGELIDVSGDYCETSVTLSGCDSTHCINLKVDPIIEIIELVSLCDGDSLFYNSNVYTQNGMYCEVFTASNGCDSTQCVDVSFEAFPNIVISDTLILAGDTIQFSLPEEYTYEWSPPEGLSCSDCPDPIASPSDSTIYTVTITNETGCQSITQFSVGVVTDCAAKNLEVPNTITPNGDGLNDTFKIANPYGLEEVVSMEIYNRWGQKVFKAAGRAAVWDATYKGEHSPAETYIYIIRVRCSGGKDDMLVGDLTVIR